MKTKPYNTYQRVINFNTPISELTKRNPVDTALRKRIPLFKVVKLPKTQNMTPALKRTRTGCLTCRQRKKKCDEERTNGKCQACTRNFLSCGWPVDHSLLLSSHSASPVSLQNSPTDRHSKISVPDLCSPGNAANPLYNVYPSPAVTPTIKTCPMSPITPVDALILPPSRCHSLKNNLKIKSNTNADLGERFVITSFDHKQTLCPI